MNASISFSQPLDFKNSEAKGIFAESEGIAFMGEIWVLEAFCSAKREKI